jgi:outer membrane protein OmpA-like peptidoglycan-associated protein
MEQRLGHDFGAVRVHADSHAAASADAVASQAYTVGSHIVLGRTVATGDEQGRQVLAHELVHTIQQGRDEPAIGPLPVGSLSDAGERRRILAHGLAHTIQQGRDSSTVGPLPVSSPTDASEHEAERLAQAAMSRPAGTAAPGRPTGAGQVVTRAPPAIQRVCGGAQIGSPAGCAGRGGDIADFGSTSEDVFRFVRDCDDLAAGEQARLTSYAARIGPDDEVTIDGFASEEGAAEVNLDLSCARARAAADVLAAAAAGLSPRPQLFSHGGTPGDRPMHRSVVITVSPVPLSQPPTTPPTPVTPPPAPAVNTPPAPETEDCEPWQTTMLTDHLKDARTWVNDAYRKIDDYAFVYANPRHSTVPRSPATAQIVRSALLDNFHTAEAGHILQIRDNFAELRSELNSDLTFECEDAGCKDQAYVRGAFAFIRRWGDIHVCPPWYKHGYFRRVTTLIHERAHQYPGATDNAYEWEAGYATLSAEDAIDNADSYGVIARQIYHGGAHGPGT